MPFPPTAACVTTRSLWILLRQAHPHLAPGRFLCTVRRGGSIGGGGGGVGCKAGAAHGSAPRRERQARRPSRGGPSSAFHKWVCCGSDDWGRMGTNGDRRAASEVLAERGCLSPSHSPRRPPILASSSAIHCCTCQASICCRKTNCTAMRLAGHAAYWKPAAHLRALHHALTALALRCAADTNSLTGQQLLLGG